MTPEIIHVALLEEGVRVWRPAPAHRVDQSTFVVLRPEDYDPQAETWEFPPGSLVTCRQRAVNDGTILAAVARVPVPDRQTA